ncbi:hypothetical protein [Lentzea aerocolonigenes]|uniref:hypothetical protein n=1 Tax=Lentzea aerocolonigenes TaxID=68170 RepID=UPI000695CD69|nr:hypothetical protein [Lentzea aerocolonigenes]
MLHDENGFLLPVSDPAWSVQESDPPLPVAELPGAGRTFALLAAAGAGKTTTFRALAGLEPNAVVLNAAPLTRDDLRRRLESACEARHPVYVDGLDQAVLHDSRLLQWLEDELTTEEACLVPWRLACRSAAWEASLGRALMDALPHFVEWRLLPLDRKGAELVVSAAGHSGPEFVVAVVEAGLGRLSACAAQLITTAKYWSRYGRLPSGSVEAIQFEIDAFLAEPNDRLRPTTPIDRARRIAQRIGAFTAFSGAQSLSLVPHAEDGATLGVDRLPSAPEPAQPSSPIRPEEYREVLGTALFEFEPPGLVVFRHQMYVEYLAAAYLVERHAEPEQIGALLGTNSNGVVPFSRVGIAAWLAALKPGLVEQLIADNVETFAFSAATVELSSDTARAAVVEAVLEASARDELDPRWDLDLTGLVHATLEEQLARRLPIAPAKSKLLWWLARLAIAGRCAALARPLLQAAQDVTCYPFARSEAVLAVGRLGDDIALTLLKDLLSEELADADNEVRAALIEALHPRHLSTLELAFALRPHRSGFLGRYRMMLRELADDIPAVELALFIRGLIANVGDGPDSLQHYENLPNKLITRAWSHADDPELREALAQLVTMTVRTHHWSRTTRDQPWMDGPVERRRALALAVAGLADDVWIVLVTTGLIRVDDVEWLIEELPAMPMPTAKPLCTCLFSLLHNPTARIADLILAMPPEHPAYDVTEPWRGASDVHSLAVAAQRRLAAEEHSYAMHIADRRVEMRRSVARLVEKLDTNPMSWWRLTVLLGEDDDDAVFNEDLISRPGWQHLSKAGRAAVLEGGARYLTNHRPEPRQWCSSPTLNTGEAMPDWEGVHLLSTLAHHAPQTLPVFSTEVWAAWSHSIVATWLVRTSDSNELMRHALLDIAATLVPELIVEAALDHLDDLQVAGSDQSLSPVYWHLAPLLAEEIAQRLLANRYTGVLAGDALDLVAQHADHAVALDTCLQLKARDRTDLADRARARLATLAPNLVIDELSSTTPDPAAVALVAPHLYIFKLDHCHLVRAASILLDTYPHTADEPEHPDARFTSQRHAQNLRGQLLRQLADHGHANALDALRRGRSELDHRIISTDYLRLARFRQAELTLAPTAPDELIELLRTSDARLVHNDADLVNVVLRMLAEQQHWIRHKGAFREIWNGTMPQHEDDISDWLWRRCHQLARSGIVVNREVHVVRNSARGGIGTRMDLTAESRSPAAPDAFVAIEAKRVDSNELLTSMSDQLVRRYLQPRGLNHGIYLAYWLQPDQRPTGWSRSAHPTAAGLLEVLRQQAEDERAQGMHITPVVLDVSRPK